MNDRFTEERKRLGFANPHALAVSLGVSHTSVRRIEEGQSIPGGELLAAFATLGADIQYVLTGRRAKEIDTTLLGLVEAALRNAFVERRGSGGVERLKGWALAQAYNTAIGQLRPGVDLAVIANDAAFQTIDGYDDPADPEMLERVLLRPSPGPVGQSGQTMTITGSGNRGALGTYNDNRQVVKKQRKP